MIDHFFLLVLSSCFFHNDAILTHFQQPALLFRSVLQDQFHLPPSGKLYVYDAQGNVVQGPYTSANHTPEGMLWTAVIEGEEAVIELRVAEAERGQVRLALVFSQTEFSEQLTIDATVVWCTPRQGRFQVGVKFAPLTPQHRAYLDLFIKFLDEGGPLEEEHE